MVSICDEKKNEDKISIDVASGFTVRIQTLQREHYKFPLKISLREVNKRSKYFLFGVHFISFDHHYHDDVLRKLVRK